ncbi:MULTISPECIES: MbtH family NRPS accessory protein [unclassified Streptomyces]|nr:MbtH family NRPS accessory protein [Streptomyces sp. NBC_01239]MCX4812795.1 MbtH family NRPS accessory protein [Streptomyces sp. NBC_01239]
MTETSWEAAESATWLAVRNEQGRHSIWPAGLSVPPGWSEAGYRGDKPGCLEWISENWADPRPAGVGRVAT